MTIRITEDEDESGGYAFIDLGRPLASPLLSFRRQDTEPRHLGAEGWQPEVAWLAPLAVTERDGRAVARFGPNVADRIEELVPIEIVAQDGTSFGVVAWPTISPAPSGGGILAGLPAAAPTLTRDGIGGPSVAATEAVPLPEPEPAPPQDAAPAAPPAPAPAARKSRLLWPLVALMLLALAAGGAYLYRDRLPDLVARREAPPGAEPAAGSSRAGFPPDGRRAAAALRPPRRRARAGRRFPGARRDGARLPAGERGLPRLRGGRSGHERGRGLAARALLRPRQRRRGVPRGGAARHRAGSLLLRPLAQPLPRHTEALRALCEGSAASDRLRAICRP
ncbi:hypothetical protein [Methylobacterium tardum]|uniref:hypothetical protein n=1 Tax=Methylobacterium tardum TaxID=374432 RepID=UPI003614311A